VEVGHTAERPGVTFHSPGGRWDLTGRAELETTVKNLSERAVTVHLAIDNPGSKRAERQNCCIESVAIPAGEEAAVRLKIRARVPAALQEKLRGMRGTPGGFASGGRGTVDPADVAGISVYVYRPSADCVLEVSSIVAGGSPAFPLPQRVDDLFPMIDRFGQYMHKDWPGKTHSDYDLKKAIEAERADLAAHAGPKGWNRYGGWAAGPRQEATGRFRVEKIQGKWWMIDPEGCLYWSHGPVRVTPASAVTPLDGREFYFTALPEADSPFAVFYTTRDALLWPYYEARGIKRTYDFSSANAFRKYGPDWFAKYADLAHERLRSWGMNTIANSSDARICRQRRTPYTDRFELKSPDIEGSHLGWWKFKDPFHAEFRANFRKQLAARKEELDDPWCFGFFVDNEISWGGDTALAEWTMQSPATQPAKIELLRRLREKYGSIAALNTTWGTRHADWNALLESKEKPPPGSREDCAAFSAVLTEAYFKNIREEFKAAAPKALYLGCRFAGSTKAAVQIGARYCDVISYNLYRHTLDDFKLPEGVDKPVMIGEFHFGALDRGMFHPSLIQVENQAARGKAYATYIASALRHPNFIGAHWHQYGEQPTTGRFDGENLQNGLLDVCDTPYPETIAGIREVGYRMYEIRSGGGE